MLKAPLILNVNCAKILAKKFDFIACAKSIKKSFRMMYSNLCLSFRETVPLNIECMHGGIHSLMQGVEVQELDTKRD